MDKSEKDELLKGLDDVIKAANESESEDEFLEKLNALIKLHEDHNKKFTMDKLDSVPPGGALYAGYSVDSPEGINLANTGRQLKWIAIKGYNNDWCIYAHFSFLSYEAVASQGDKVTSPDNIKKLVPCTDEVFARYRY